MNQSDSRNACTKRRVLALLAAVVLLFGQAIAQNLDDGFDPQFQSSSGPVVIETVLRLTSGELLVGGLFEEVDGIARPNLVRLNHDGSVDANFQIGTGPNAIIMDLAEQSDGKILMVGDFTSFNGESVGRIARLDPDGSLDVSFSINSQLDQLANTVAVQPNGAIVVGGTFTQVNGQAYARLARLFSDGTLDPGFVNPQGEGTVWDLSLTEDGSIYAGGDFETFGGQPNRSLVRLNADGSLDSAFSSSLDTGTIRSMVLLENHDLVIAGSLFTSDGNSLSGVAQLQPSGALATEFQPVFSMSGQAYSLAIQTDGNLIVGGSMTIDGQPRNLIRLLPDGTIDSAFAGFSPINDDIRSVLVESAQTLVIGGQFDQVSTLSREGLARLLPDGMVDQRFANATGINGDVFEIAHQPAGLTLVAGSFSTTEPIPSANLTGLDAAGDLEVGFDSGTGTDRFIRRLLAIENGDTLVSGGLRSYNGQPVNGVFRVASDGSLVNSFEVDDALAGDNPLTVRQRPDGRVFLGGFMSGSAAVPLNNLVQLNADGSIDSSFDVGTGANDAIWSSALQADGKAVIGGSFTQIDGVTRNGVARLNVDGSLDTGFDVGLGVDARVEAIVALNSGQTLIGGRFRNVDGISTGGLARLNSDGTVDHSFQTLVSGFVSDLDVLANGKILVAGNFIGVGGQSVPYLTVLNQDGSRDLGFSTAIQPDDQTFALEPTQYGKAVIAGIQTMMGTTPSTGLDRFTLNDAPGQRLIRQGNRLFWQLSGSMPMPNRVWVDLSIDGQTYVEVAEAQWIGDQWFADGLLLEAGWQFIRLRGFNPPSMPVQYVYRIHEVPNLIASQLSVSFGPQQIGVTTSVFPIELANDGFARLTAMVTSDTADFEIDPSGCGVLELSLLPAEACTMNLIFTPSRRGIIDGTLFIDSDDPDSPLEISLTGNGFGAEIVAQRDLIHLGDVDIGQTSDATPILFENIGELSAEVTQIQIIGAHAADFQIVSGSDSCTGNTLNPDQLCGVSMVFTPSVVGPRTVILEVTTSAFNSPVQVEVFGNNGSIFMDGFE